MISDKFANIKQMQKIPFIPRKIKRAESVRELYTQKEKKQKKIKGHIINFLKKANKNYNNSQEIIRYKNKSLKKEIPNIFQKTNYDNLIIKKHLNYNNNNNSNKINNRNVDSFSKIIFSIIKSNRDKIENEFNFKIYKHSNINISTMIELNKTNFHKNKNNNI